MALAFLPAELAGPVLPQPFFAALLVWSILFSLFIMRLSAIQFNDGYTRVGEALDRAREDVLAAGTERARSLTCIGSKVAHELKNPLSAVKGLVQLLSRSAADERSRERLEVIAGEVSRMEVILRDYLTFSRPLEDLRPEPVEIGAVADDVLAVLEARAEAAGVSLVRTGGPVVATGDARRLKEALLNLVANALEATPRQGSVEVGVSGDGGDAVILVRDTGKGIPPELRQVGRVLLQGLEEQSGGCQLVLVRRIFQELHCLFIGSGFVGRIAFEVESMESFFIREKKLVVKRQLGIEPVAKHDMADFVRHDNRQRSFIRQHVEKATADHNRVSDGERSPMAPSVEPGNGSRFK